jgi:8-amino-3,8-dideoxy-alpha-D-manno-octulosonate transaminase
MYRHGQAELREICRTTRSGSWFRYYGGKTHTHAVKRLEKKIQDYTGASHVLATSSGTGALISSLAALGVGPMDEVLVPAYTFIASAAAVLAVGAVPVIVEVDETLTMDVDDLQRNISPRTKVIMPVHMAGYPCNMKAIMAIARKRGLKVLEDSAQAVGGHYHGRALGTIGHMGCFSLQWHKIISSGEGGCVLTNSNTLYERAAIYHDDAHCFRGIDQGVQSFAGVNFRMSELAGAVGCAQAARLPALVRDLQAMKKRVIARLGDLGSFRIVPSHDADGDASWKLTLIAPDRAAAEAFSRATGMDSVLNTKKTNWHIYYHWDYILEKRSASGTGFPWKVGSWESPVRYSKDMCPRTIDILQRCFHVAVQPDTTASEVAAMVARIHGGITPATTHHVSPGFDTVAATHGAPSGTPRRSAAAKSTRVPGRYVKSACHDHATARRPARYAVTRGIQ